MIYVSQPYLPDRRRLLKYIDKIYDERRLTNHGPLVQELTVRLEDYLGINNLLLVSNGTMALQVAYRVLGVDTGCRGPEAITTPFSFIATSSSMKWQGIQPIFSDIESEGWCLDPKKVEATITSKTRGIVPVHVFGNGCDVESFEKIAEKHDLKLIFDGAHAFGITYDGRSILQKGDATILSFHATKLFHTIEGGGIIFKNKEDLEKARSAISFGLCGSEFNDSPGINAKMNEFQAAMGLCVLEDIGFIIEARKKICHRYQELLEGVVTLQEVNDHCNKNHCYFPILVENEDVVHRVCKALEEKGYLARRYFYPSLDELEYFKSPQKQPISNDVSRRILCLPVYPSLSMGDVEAICHNVLLSTQNKKVAV